MGINYYLYQWLDFICKQINSHEMFFLKPLKFQPILDILNDAVKIE